MAEKITPYIADIPYTTYYYAEQSPTVLNFLAKLNGAKGRPLGQPFVYCDLGCGNGLTCNTLAAANPNSTFYGIDFNPQHIENANRLAGRAGLTNVHFIEGSFSDFGGDDLARFDYITMHGIYSWVSPDVQADTRAFIKTFLKPDGIVYVSYNALPGWAPYLPIREIMRTFTQELDIPLLERAEEGVKILNMMVEKKAPYTASSARIRQEIKRTGNSGRRYLAHEFLNDHWQPRYFSDVASEMASVGLSYCCLSQLRVYAADEKIFEEFADLLASQHGRVKRGAMKSILLNMRFRRDVYSGSDDAQNNHPAEQLSSMVFGNARSQRLRKDIPFKAEPPVRKVLIDALSNGDNTLSDCLALPELKSYEPEALFAEVCNLVGLGWMRPLSMTALKQNARVSETGLRMPAQFNQVVLADYLASGNGCWLASPVSGDGIEIDQNSGLLLQAVVDVGFADAIERALTMLGETKMPLRVDGKKVFNLDDQRSALEENFTPFKTSLIPVLIRLGILDDLT